MGWVSYHIDDVSQKAIREELNGKFCEGYNVLKSAMVGRVYYAAVRCPDGKITASVMLTHVESGYHNFAYKAMDEAMGPHESKCPKSILELLTPTDSEYANAWRKRCNEYNDKKTILNGIQYGMKVKVKETIYVKCQYRGRKAYICWEKMWKLPETKIAELGFEIV